MQEDAQKRKERGRKVSIQIFHQKTLIRFFSLEIFKKVKKRPQKTHTFFFKKRESKANQQTNTA